MKKSFVLLIALLLLITGTVYVAQTTILENKDKVTFTENVIYGDKSVVDGVTVEMRADYHDQLYWNSTYVIGEKPQVDTEYTFYPWRHTNYRYEYEGTFYTEAYSHLRYDVDFENPKENPEGLQAAMLELYEKTEPGEEGEMMVFLKDYIPYYPFDMNITGAYSHDGETLDYDGVLNLSFDESDLIWDIENSANAKEVESAKENLAVLKKFHEYFKIPILENEVYILNLRKDSDGKVIGYGESSHGSGSATGEIGIPDAPSLEGGTDTYTFDIRAAVEYEKCYFTFDTHTMNGAIVDTSLIPDGYGIYYFPYDEEKNEIYPDELKMVYALDPTIQVYHILYDESGKYLLLFTEENDAMYVSVIEEASMTLKNKVAVSTAEYGLSGIWEYDDFLVVNGEKLMVMVPDETLGYKVAWQASKETLEQASAEATLVNGGGQWYGESPVPRDIFDSAIKFDWNGETLICTNYLYDEEGYSTCDFLVAAMDETGLTYFATYTSSLTPSPSAGDRCTPTDVDPLSIRWEK